MLNAVGGPTVKRVISENSTGPVTFCVAVANLNFSRIPLMTKVVAACYEKTRLLHAIDPFRKKLDLYVHECYLPIFKVARFPI